MVYKTKKTQALQDSSQPPFWPKWADLAQNSLNVVTLDMSTYTEFGPDRPDRLRFAGLIPERLIFRPKKSIQYRLSANNNNIINLSSDAAALYSMTYSTSTFNARGSSTLQHDVQYVHV